jgi:catechol 2,3-dioxygenase-like lactoylglutathione lyase family enzyme
LRQLRELPSGKEERIVTSEATEISGLTGLDHVLIGVRDLEDAHAVFQGLGFTICPRGRHVGWGTANYCLMFPNDYIELLGIVDPGQFTNNLDRFLESREGLLGLAFACNDADAVATSFTAAGIDVEGPKDLKRSIEGPDGELWPSFRLVHPDPAALPGLRAFIVQHMTPELVWQAPWLKHPNGATGIALMTAVVEEPGETALAYSRYFGSDAIRSADGYADVECGGFRLRFTTQDQLSRVFPGLGDIPANPLPWLAGLRLSVTDIDETAAFLDGQAVGCLRDGDNMLRVRPQEACGVVLEFQQS